MRLDSDRQRIEAFMKALGHGVNSPGRIYLTGGASAVIRGWREMTLDIDLKADPEPSGFFERLAHLKEQLNINIELAAPDQFVPPLPDFYGQALAKIERGHARDQRDIECMIQSGLVVPRRLAELFVAVEKDLIRYPSVDSDSLKTKVNALAQGAA